MLELNRAKFSSNGNCGYILKPKYMRRGVRKVRFVKNEMQLSMCEDVVTFLVGLVCFFSAAFNPMLEDPLPGHRKTQLVLKIISGQQLPKPRDSMFGDRGEVR